MYRELSEINVLTKIAMITVLVIINLHLEKKLVLITLSISTDISVDFHRYRTQHTLVFI